MPMQLLHVHCLYQSLLMSDCPPVWKTDSWQYNMTTAGLPNFRLTLGPGLSPLTQTRSLGLATTFQLPYHALQATHHVHSLNTQSS